LILAVDTSDRVGLVSLELPGGDCLVRWSDRPREHLEFLHRSLGELADEADISWTDLSRAAVTLGPGSFTGLRVGLAAVKGLLFGGSVRLLPLPSLAVPALAAGAERPRLVLRRARLGEAWAGYFEAKEHLPSRERILPMTELADWLIELESREDLRLVAGETVMDELADALGSAAPRIEAEADPKSQLKALAELARGNGALLEGADIDALLPRYLAEPSVTPPKERRP